MKIQYPSSNLNRVQNAANRTVIIIDKEIISPNLMTKADATNVGVLKNYNFVKKMKVIFALFCFHLDIFLL